MDLAILNSIPSEVKKIQETLIQGGFEAFLVGGCVRDLILGRVPKDWDLTTNANPEQIQALFPHTFYENIYGTVGVVNDEIGEQGDNASLRTIEVTPYRIESTYSDHRRPDEVVFGNKLEDDLKRRDFTINALALDIKGHITDFYKGQEDLKARTLRTVGDSKTRFEEDALRMLRAIRLATELSFVIAHETTEAIKLHVKLLENVSQERIRDEFSKIIMSKEPMIGILLCEKLGVLPYISPELVRSIGVDQNKQAHKYTVYEHLLRSMQHAADKDWPFDIRLAALFHDISKPETKRVGKNGETTFYGHDVVGARVTRETLNRLRFPVKLVEKVCKLIRWHMFFSDTEQITLSAVRRLIANVGKENIWDLMKVRACDRIGTGRPKESPYRLRKFHTMIDEAMHDPISVAMLKTNGKRIMDVTQETPGRKVGYVLHALLEEVLEDPTKNTEEYLDKKAMFLMKLDEKSLENLGNQAKEVKEREESKLLEHIRKEHGVGA